VDRKRAGRGVFARAVAGTLLLVVPAAALAVVAIALGVGEREPLDLRVAPFVRQAKAAANPETDPFKWDPSRREDLERRATIGSSHVIYAMSPGGVVASAERTAKYRDEIEAAAGRHGVDPDVLEAVIFLESAGRPYVSAGPTPEAASGLAQIIPSTATELLGMQVDLEASIELTRKIARARTPGKVDELRAQRAAVDERFDPAKAIEGAATYVEIARERFGADDLAVESYHMGIGNLESVIREYLDAGDDARVADLVAAEDLSFAQIYFDSTPSRHGSAYDLLTGFGDESSDYFWKVRASQQILSAWRKDPGALQSLADLANEKATLEEVFHPEQETEVFDDAGAIEAEIREGGLTVLPYARSLGWVTDKDLGEFAEELDQEAGLYAALKPEALATLSYLAGIVRNESGSSRPLKVTSAVRDLDYQELLVGSNPEATDEYSLHTTGWSFDIRREYESDKQAAAFQYALDRLSALALIDYAVEPGAIHITASGDGAEKLLG
jgi:soluble lytic murein transglycosylase-like protein